MTRPPFDPDISRVAHTLADAARTAILPLFRRAGLADANKLAGGYYPVTLADRAAERAMRDILEQERPHDAILGEEYGAQNGTSGLTWVLDPIDGTRGFVAGTPTWGVLIALSDATGPKLGIVDQPFTQERFAGGFGRATYDGVIIVDLAPPNAQRFTHIKPVTWLDRARVQRARDG